MDSIKISSQDKFYFYNSSIGDLTDLIKKYSVPDLSPTQGFLTNAFGVKINPKHFPQILTGMEGKIEPLPIPANWHADIAEFGAALRAVDLAKDKFTVVELGCGWGCWLNITGAVARNKGLKVHLVGVEGDAGHVRFANESLTENGFNKNEFFIHHGIASAHIGMALFPIQDQSGVSWGLEPIFDISPRKAEKLCRGGKYQSLKQISLEKILPIDCDRVDLLHVDIQGGEIPFFPDSIGFINKKVAMSLIGTHSKKIEADLFECFQKAGWILEVERPLVLGVGKKIYTIVDGVQLWRNPRLLPDSIIYFADSKGEITAVEYPNNVNSDKYFDVLIRVLNNSNTDWQSVFSDYPVRLSYHWLDESDNVIIYEGLRTELKDGTLKQNENLTQTIKVLAPKAVGKFKLKLCIVQEGVKWFNEPTFTSEVLIINITE